jgi:SPOR domain
MTRYYTTVSRLTGTGRKYSYLLGPFETEEAARARIPDAKREAALVDPWTAFDLFGTCGVTGAPYPIGVLNDRLC